MTPLVSVIIPCFNAAKFIRETLESVMSQTYRKFEVIVIDDGSTDSSKDILRDYQGRIRAEFLHHQGVSKARNHGVRLASGVFIQYLDADDLLTTDSLAIKIKAVEESSADVVYGAWQRLVEDQTGQFQKGEIISRSLEEVHPEPEIATTTDFWAPPAALLYSRKIVEKIGSWNEMLPIIQDARYLQDAALYKAEFVHVPQVTAYYREHRAGSLSKRNPQAFIKDCFLNISQVHVWWQEHGGITSNRKKALRQVYGYVARASFESNIELFERAYRELIALEPGYVPAGPAVLKYLSRLLGYRRAEYIAMNYRKVKKLSRFNEKKIKKWLALQIAHFGLVQSIALMSRERRFPILLWQRLAGLMSASYKAKGLIHTIFSINSEDKMILGLDIQQEFDRNLYFFGAHEKETAAFLRRRLASPEVKVFYDIGANVGFYTVMAGQILRAKQGCVESFEPVPWIYKRLVDNIDLNLLNNVKPHCVGVSDIDGLVTLYLPHGNNAFSTNATLNKQLAQQFNHLFAARETPVDEIQIQTDSIDSLIENRKILPPQLMHMDIEGEEIKALLGMKNVLRTYKPEIVLEILPGRHAAIRSFLGSLNYQLYHMGAGKLYVCNDSCVRHSGRDWYAKVGAKPA